MKNAYKIFQRSNGIYYLQKIGSTEQRILQTQDKNEDISLLEAENRAYQLGALNLH